MARNPPWLAALASLLLVAIQAPRTAHASDADKAEELIRQANELRSQNRDSAAMPLLRQAYELAPSPRTAAQLGLAELALGYWVESEAHLSEALAPAHHPWIDRNRKVLERALTDTRAHVGAVTVEGTPTGAEVRLNGKIVGTFPLAAPMKVVEGRVSIEVAAPGFTSESRTLDLAGGSARRLSFDLRPVAQSSTPPPRAPAAVTTSTSVEGNVAAAAPTAPPAWRRALPGTLAGAAVVAGGLGIWQHVVWRKDQSSFETIDACAASLPRRGDDDRCQGLYDKFAADRTRTYVAYGVAGGLAAAAAASFILLDSRDEARASVQVTPHLIALSLGGTF